MKRQASDQGQGKVVLAKVILRGTVVTSKPSPRSSICTEELGTTA